MPQAHISSKYFRRMIGIWRAFPNFCVHSNVHAFARCLTTATAKFSIKLHGKLINPTKTAVKPRFDRGVTAVILRFDRG